MEDVEELDFVADDRGKKTVAAGWVRRSVSVGNGGRPEPDCRRLASSAHFLFQARGFS
jgi:hypothetical protein